MKIQQLKREFLKSFSESRKEVSVFFAPGRINLIGEHLDYNGGFVLPCALSMGTWLAIRKCEDPVIRIISKNFDGRYEISMQESFEKRNNDWWNYPLGVIREFLAKAELNCGFEMMFDGDLPVGVGLSSSASIEVVTAFALNELFETKLALREIALLSRRAENEFVGVQCGIMDQYAVALGKKNHALFLNCETVEHEYVPVNIAGYSIVISNTNKPRYLQSSDFNTRYNECRTALKTMQRLLCVNEIAEASPESFEGIEHWFADENIRKRAHHLVYENERVKNARLTLMNNNISSLAKIMNESNSSMRDYFEVSCFELETIISAARSTTGCIASKISGAGFGGCVLNLVATESIQFFKERVSMIYQNATGLKASFYDVEIGHGVIRYT